jgi:phenylalanyl-tRNA synthetase beta subunit
MIKKSNLFMVALTCVLMLPYSSAAQNSDFGNWLIYIGNKKVNSKWNVHNEVQYRNYDAIGDLEQLLLRTGVGYNLSENNHNLLLGYAQLFAAYHVLLRL